MMMRQIVPDNQELGAICQMVQSKLGFKFGREKVPLVISRLGKRLRDLGLDSYGQYLQRVKMDPNEETVMLNLLTTNVTHFFREPKQFQYLIDQVFPELLAKKDKTVRCWSAGCATGEEAYTMGMLFREHFPREWRIKILASDVCTASLKYGSDGLYTREQIQDIPKALLEKNFIRQGQDFRVAEDLRRMVFFKQINLFGPKVLPSRIIMDFIFCRNVFIYFTKSTQKNAVELFFQHLAPGGHLFLGHSESIDTAQDQRWLGVKGCVYRKLENKV